jgi:hypothetical protein
LKRIISVAVAALSVVFLTTGCVKLNMDLTVNNDDTVSGTMVFAVAKSLADLGSESEGGSAPDTEGLLGEIENVTVEPFDDGDFVGSSYTFEAVPLEVFKPEVGDESAFAIARDGDNIIVSGVLDTSSEGQDLSDNPFGGAFVESILSTTDLRVSVTLPGEIRETNGEVDGQTITWRGSFGESLDMQATAYSPKIDPLLWIVLSSLGVGLLVTVLVLGILKFRRRLSLTPAEKRQSVPSAKVALSAKEIKSLEAEYEANPDGFAIEYLSTSELGKWKAAGKPSLKPWIGIGMINFKKWLDLHR